jgi:hypothetical protein
MPTVPAPPPALVPATGGSTLETAEPAAPAEAFAALLEVVQSLETSAIKQGNVSEIREDSCIIPCGIRTT